MIVGLDSANEAILNHQVIKIEELPLHITNLSEALTSNEIVDDLVVFQSLFEDEAWNHITKLSKNQFIEKKFPNLTKLDL